MHECTRDNERYIDLDCQQPFLTFVDTVGFTVPCAARQVLTHRPSSNPAEPDLQWIYH